MLALLDAPAAPADLILARILPAKTSLPPARLRADLAPLFREPPSADALAGVLVELRAVGFVTRSKTMSANSPTGVSNGASEVGSSARDSMPLRYPAAGD